MWTNYSIPRIKSQKNEPKQLLGVLSPTVVLRSGHYLIESSEQAGYVFIFFLLMSIQIQRVGNIIN